MGRDTRSATALRHQEIEDVVDARGFVRVQELSDRFSVSTVTIRSDLDALEAAGRLRRVRGGALSRERGRHEVPFEQARREASAGKAAIARRAVDEVRDGDAIVLDVGTTTAAIATELVRRAELQDLTVITSSLTIALELERAAERIRIVVTGGTLRPLQHSLVDPLATQIFDGLNAHVAFLGCSGVHPTGGVTNINLPEAEVKRAMLRSARRCVIVADGSKVGEIELARVCGLDDVDLLVTDDTADAAVLAQLDDAGVSFVAVAGDAGR